MYYFDSFSSPPRRLRRFTCRRPTLPRGRRKLRDYKTVCAAGSTSTALWVSVASAVAGKGEI